MRLPVLLAVCGLSLGAVACATAPGAIAPVETASSGAPEPLADHDWVSPPAEDNERSLLYGARDSDDIWVILACRSGAGRLKLLQPAVAPHPILLESGGDTETYSAEAEPSEMHDVMLTAEAPTSDPVFQRFRRLGWLAVHGEAGRVVMAAHPESTGVISDFFDFCG